MLNETFFHDEFGTFRAVTGAAYNIPNSYGDIISGTTFPTKGTVPLAATKLGTFKSTAKAVRGTGTEFTKLIQGCYLYDGSVLRQVDYVVSDTLLFLRQAFPSDVGSDTAVKICERQYFREILAKNTHATQSATLQEAPMRPGAEIKDGGAPVSYDASGGGEISFKVSW